MRNVDILLWEDNPTTRSLVRVLNKYPDLTLFSQKRVIQGFYPDIVVITAEDPYMGLNQRLEALSRFPCSTLVYIRDFYDSVAVSALFLGGFTNLLTTDLKGDALHQIFITIGETAFCTITTNYKSMFLKKQFSRENNDILTCRELAVLGGLVRAHQPNKLAKLLNTTEADIGYTISDICSKLHIRRKNLASVSMLMKYGSIGSIVKLKTYKIKVVRKKPSYYVIPKLFTDEANI